MLTYARRPQANTEARTLRPRTHTPSTSPRAYDNTGCPYRASAGFCLSGTQLACFTSASTKAQILTQTTSQRLFATAVGAEQQALQGDYLCCVRSRLLFFFFLFFFFLVFPLRQRSEPSSMLCKAIVLVSSVAVDNSSCFALRMCLSFASSSAVFELAYRQQVHVSRERERERE